MNNIVPFRLRIEEGAGPRPELVSKEDRVTIGRGPPADLVIDDESVSKNHCEIAYERDAYVLRDLGSEHGTWIGGVRVREVCLPAGEVSIGIGHSRVSFSVMGGAVEESHLDDGEHFGRLVGASSAMRALFARLERMAARDTTLLLEGESGTGKEVAAMAVHEAGPRRAGPFVVVDCGSIPRSLVELELFGCERGAFPGLEEARLGAFVRAHGGTIFLDEVGELDAEIQPRLLRVLEDREIRPIGAARPVPIDVRIIAATHSDLRRQVNEGSFREDLYYRLAVACLRLPTLRERTSDIPLLVRHFLEQHSRADGVEYTLDSSAMRRLMQRPWPGNVRELRNAVEQILAFGSEDMDAPRNSMIISLPFKVAKAQVVERFEREYLASVLAQHGGNITAAATAAELDRVHFLRLMDRYGLRKPRNRTASNAG